MILPQGYFQAVTNANVIFFYSKKKKKKKAFIDRGIERMRRALNQRQSFQLEGVQKDRRFRNPGKFKILIRCFASSCSCFSVLSAENSAL